MIAPSMSHIHGLLVVCLVSRYAPVFQELVHDGRPGLVREQERLRALRLRTDALLPNGLPTSTSAAPTFSTQAPNAAIRSEACSGAGSGAGPR